MLLDEAQLSDLLDYVDDHLAEAGCDHTLRSRNGGPVNAPSNRPASFGRCSTWALTAIAKSSRTSNPNPSS